MAVAVPPLMEKFADNKVVIHQLTERYYIYIYIYIYVYIYICIYVYI